jgi:hypothetical protein
VNAHRNSHRLDGLRLALLHLGICTTGGEFTQAGVNSQVPHLHVEAKVHNALQEARRVPQPHDPHLGICTASGEFTQVGVNSHRQW